MTGIETPITIIIADYSQSDSIIDCLENLNSWFPKKILISNDIHAKDKLKDDSSSNFILHKSQSIFQLWKQGLTKSETQWNLLITSNEIVTGHLKSSIENQIKTKPAAEKLFKIKKKVVFLKKVLKYPLEWPSEAPSCLIFLPQKENLSFKPRSYKQSSYLTGELIQFSTPTIADSIREILRLAEVEADRIFHLSSLPNLATLIIKAFSKSVYEFFYSLILKKAFKEGYEGITFSIMRSVIPPLALLRYFEKYFRGGKRIASKLSSISNILVIKVRGAGDLVLSTPILRNLNKLLPHAKIHVLVPKKCTPLLDNNPYIESITDIDHGCDNKAIRKVSRELMHREIDLAINLDSTTRTSKLLKKIPAKMKINRSYYFRDKDTDVLVGFTNTFRSVIERELDILRSIGLKPLDKHTEVFLEEREIEWAKKFFTSNSLSRNKKTVLVAPISSLEIRDWGIEKFALLCRNLTFENNIQIIVNVAPEEIARIKPIINLAPEVLIFSGSIRELLGLINESDLLIGSDSGPTQFSIALKVPTITLNGPSISSFYRDPDLVQSPHHTFYKNVPCRDLLHTQCFSKMNPITQRPSCDAMICLDFSVDEVTEKARDIIGMKKK